MNKLKKEDIRFISDLCKIDVDDSEIDLYCSKLNDLLSDIDYINDIDVDSDDVFIAPFGCSCRMDSFSEREMLSKDDILGSAPHVLDPYVEVRGVFDD